MNGKVCCFIGHRNAVATPELCDELKKLIVYLIEEKDVKCFLFGSASLFDKMCLKMVTELQKEYPKITRVYVRSQYPYIEKSYREYLLQSYDDTRIPSRVKNAGKAAYVERNQEIINESDFCVFYYDETYVPPLRNWSKGELSTCHSKSGTRLAYEYAKKKGKEVINLYR